jgi:uncharacterized membrane protein YccC
MTTGRAFATLAVSIEKTIRTGLSSAKRLRPSALTNGIVAGLGVACVTLLVEVLAPQHASSALLGAICVSIADAPTPLLEKLRRIGFSWVTGSLALLAAATAAEKGMIEAVVVMAAGFCAAMVTAFGRNAVALSVAILVALALSHSAAPPGVSPSLAALWFATGGFLYAVYAAILTPLTMLRIKRMLLQETLQGLADYLRTQKSALDAGLEQDRVYAMLIASQTALAERLQLARNVVFVGVSGPPDRQLAAELLIAIDIFEAALSEQADLDTLLARDGEGDQALEALRALLLVAAGELDHLSRSVTDSGWRDVVPIGDKGALLAKVRQRQDDMDRGRRDALRATANKIDLLFTQIGRLADAQKDLRAAVSLVDQIDLAPFVQRSIFDLRSIGRELNLRSPVARFAVRLSLAMFCGSLIGEMLPYRAHGSWILLTVALVMRANYSVTRQRRDERLLGNVFGSFLAAAALSVAPVWLVPIIVVVSVVTSHAFALQSYLVASIASCVMALMLIHIAEPNESIFFLMRVVDTGIGGAIAYAFSFFLPYWEYQTIAKLTPDLLHAELDYARQALTVDFSDQAYRLSRRRLFDAIAALSTALSRMLEEPASARYEVRILSEFLAAAYVFAAHLASVQTFARDRLGRREPGLAAKIELTRRTVEEKLTYVQEVARPTAETPVAFAAPDVNPTEGEAREDDDLLVRRLRQSIEAADRVGALAMLAIAEIQSSDSARSGG